MVTTSKKNTIILKNTISPRQKRKNNSSGLKNVFPLAEVKKFLKIISGNGRKWFPLARK